MVPAAALFEKEASMSKKLKRAPDSVRFEMTNRLLLVGAPGPSAALFYGLVYADRLVFLLGALACIVLLFLIAIDLFGGETFDRVIRAVRALFDKFVKP